MLSPLQVIRPELYMHFLCLSGYFMIFVLIIVILFDDKTPKTETCITRNTVHALRGLSCVREVIPIRINDWNAVNCTPRGMNLDLPITKQERRLLYHIRAAPGKVLLVLKAMCWVPLRERLRALLLRA
jgi:hypothetical protein